MVRGLLLTDFRQARESGVAKHGHIEELHERISV